MVRPAVADDRDGPDETMASTLPHPIDLPFRPLFYNTPGFEVGDSDIPFRALILSTLLCFESRFGHYLPPNKAFLR